MNVYNRLLHLPLTGKVSLVTGASRGIGAATALKLARLGSDVVLNFRSKAPRAEEVANQIVAFGRKALPVQADLTSERDLTAMMDFIQQSFSCLNVLILNASGGLEKGKSEDYAMALNHTAQLRTAQLGSEIMPWGSRIVFVTSHWAHFYGTKPIADGYEAVAKSKYAGEHALRQYAGELHQREISLVIVSGDAIEGTITPRLLERQSPGLMSKRPTGAAKLPTVDEFAETIAQAAANPALVSGHTMFVGSTEF